MVASRKKHARSTSITTVEAPTLQEHNTPTPAEREQALQDAQSQIQALEMEQQGVQERIATIAQEIATREQEIAERHAATQQLANAVAQAKQSVETQEHYVSLFAGNTGTKELQALQASLSEAQVTYNRLSAEYATRNDQDQATISALRDEIHTSEKSCQEIARQLASLREARQRLIREHGQQSYEECKAVLGELLQRDQECRDALQLAHSALIDARSAFLKRLGPWPALRLQLEDIYPLSEDASTKALQAYLALLDVLLEYGAAIDRPVASMPDGLVSFLSEMELSRNALQALQNDDKALIAGRREYLANVLVLYRRNLARYVGLR